MERLTHARCNGIKTGYYSPKNKEVLAQRLAEYENTGLEPDQIRKIVMSMPAAFNKEKVIEEIKSWEKASHDAGIQSKYAGLDNKASGYYQESRAYHRAVEIVEKGGE